MIKGLALIGFAMLPCVARAQGSADANHQLRGGFIATLGTDTMQVESFTRSARRIEGIVVTRSPVTRIMRYEMTFADDGAPLRMDMRTTDGAGKPLTINGSQARFEYSTDSVIRLSLRNGVMDTVRMQGKPIPSPSLPYLGQSYLMYELAFREARQTAGAANEGSALLVTTIPAQVRPSRARVWFVGNDSVEMDYFGVARSGFHFDANGRLDRADWTGTTYRYRVARVASVDVESIAQRWAAADARGAAVGALSPRDTTRASVGTSSVLIDYSRPSRRGRDIWGDVVKWGTVWRLGADFATHLVLSDTMTIGGATVPAGAYTLWMLPIKDGPSLLVINKQTRIFGTAYNAAHDLVRVPLQRSEQRESTERLTLAVEAGSLRIRWGTLEWSTPIAVGRPVSN
jgi:hypothetical protein